MDVPPLHLFKDEKDELFAQSRQRIDDFCFDKNTAMVFDDMVDRSVPFYQEIQRMATEIAADFALPGTHLYDLGCSTGTTLLALDAVVQSNVHFIGVDNSEEMLHQARGKLLSANTNRTIEMVHTDLHEGPTIHNASVVLMLLTLQFVRPMHREQVLSNIYQGLNNNGCLLLIEKVTSSNTTLNRLFINYYYNFKKRNQYSDLEIAQKREALENVLIPYRSEENLEMLHRAGFRHVEEFFRWYNFSAVVAVK